MLSKILVYALMVVMVVHPSILLADSCADECDADLISDLLTCAADANARNAQCQAIANATISGAETAYDEIMEDMQTQFLQDFANCANAAFAAIDAAEAAFDVCWANAELQPDPLIQLGIKQQCNAKREADMRKAADDKKKCTDDANGVKSTSEATALNVFNQQVSAAIDTLTECISDSWSQYETCCVVANFIHWMCLQGCVQD